MKRPESFRNAVFEIQTRLRELHFSNYPVDALIPDGIYDERTRRAVVQFQRFVKLPMTGKVDKATWEALDAVYLAAVFENSRPKPLYAFPETTGYVVSMGEISDIVMIIQILLDSLGAYYDGMPVVVSGEYDESTRLAVELFQKSGGIKQTGNVDKETWNALVDMYAKVNNIVT